MIQHCYTWTMKQIEPNYYKKFKCIADRCKHNCCIGWEIDIDPETMALYQSLPDPFGRRLEKEIALKPEPHFILDPNERCPFLNDRNLCDIITEFGDGALCQICADHPRFYNEIGNRIEVGLGLCCEAAAELILHQKEPTRFLSDSAENDQITDEEAALLSLRDQAIAIMQNRDRPLSERIDRYKQFFEIHQERPLTYWLNFYKTLERLNTQWDQYLQKCEEKVDLPFETAYEQLAVYFIYRHLIGAVDDGMVKERAAFVLISLNMIHAISESCSASLEEIARLYSSEIEYSDENIQKILTELS